MSEGAPHSKHSVLPDQVHSPSVWDAHEVAHWQPSFGTDEKRVHISDAPPETDELEPVDCSYPKYEEPVDVLLTRLQAHPQDVLRATSPDTDHPGCPEPARSTDAGMDPNAEPMKTRGAANFSAWQQTRRELDGEGATFVVEVRDEDGNLQQIDLLHVTFKDLPVPIQAKFEYRKFPDLLAFTLPRATDDTLQPSGVEEVSESENPPSRSEHEAGQHSHTPSVSNPSVSTDSAGKGIDEEGTTQSQRYQQARQGLVQAAPAFGINLGGLFSGARQAAKGVGRATGDASRSAASALATIGETLGAASGRQRERLSELIRDWREARAKEALEALGKAQEQFETTLRMMREDPDLRSYFRAWDLRDTAASRRRAVQRFREAIMARRIGEATIERIYDLFQQAEIVHVHALRALRQINRAAHGADLVQGSLVAWFRRVSEQAGPLTSVGGESLCKKLAQMADAVKNVFEQLTERIARLTSARPT